MKRARHILAGAALLFAGCAAHENASLHKTLRTRAAFDLQCSDSSLKITDLDFNGNGYVSVAGVEGCNHRATYVFDGYWLLDALDGQPATPKNTNTSTNEPVQKEANQ